MTIRLYHNKNRSSHRKCYFKKAVLKNLVKLTGNNCARISFLIKLQPEVCNIINKEVP